MNHSEWIHIISRMKLEEFMNEYNIKKVHCGYIYYGVEKGM